MKRRIRNYDRTSANDIRYRGPLSYRHLMIIGWISISFVVLAVLTRAGINLDPNGTKWLLRLHSVSENVGFLAIPMFLLANFCIILDEKRTYKELLLKYAGLTLLIVVLYLLVFRRYLHGTLNVFLKDGDLTLFIINTIIKEGTRTGTLTFNLFIDLFLCTLFMFFLNSEPKGFFSNKKTLFRLLAFIPVLYEAGSLVIRVLSSTGKIDPPFFIYPLLTTKPPLSFVMFITLALFIRIRERHFLRYGKTRSDYKAFLRTNANSLQFSIFTTIVIVITCLVDLILFTALAFFLASKPEPYIEQYEIKKAEEQTHGGGMADFLAETLFPDEAVTESAGMEEADPAELLDVISQTESTEQLSSAEELLTEVQLSSAEELPTEVQLSSAEELPTGAQLSSAEELSTEKQLLSEEQRAILGEAMADEEIRTKVWENIVNQVQAWGIGRHMSLLILIPFVLLFSYTRNHKNPRADLMIPIGGIILALLVLIEGLYQEILLLVPAYIH